MAYPSRRPADGQILVLFALGLVAILAMAALLFDAAEALVTRRKLQNAGDAAALAGANVIDPGQSSTKCSASMPAGAPRADVRDAVLASLAMNVPGFDPASVSISCPATWHDEAVRVTLDGVGGTYFAGAVIGEPLRVTTTSTAANARRALSGYSVVLLDPSNPSWHNARRGCPSFLLSGGPTVLFEGSVQVNSACPASGGGALATNGNAASVTLASGQHFSLVGGYSPSALTLSPAPLTGQTAVSDPLAKVPDVTTAGMALRSASRLVLNGESRMLEPGIYRGGIELRSSAKAFLQPGIYVLDGGGLSLGAQSQFYSVDAGVTATDPSSWSSQCGDATCGVLLYNMGTASGANALGQISASAGAVLKLRAYDERAVADGVPAYRNILIFQARSPAPTHSYAQPVISLNGGGQVDMSGSVYAPGALVQMGGTSGGSGGSSVNLTLQFIAWDLQLHGNSAFRFYYLPQDFPFSIVYGLVE